MRLSDKKNAVGAKCLMGNDDEFNMEVLSVRKLWDLLETKSSRQLIDMVYMKQC